MIKDSYISLKLILLCVLVATPLADAAELISVPVYDRYSDNNQRVYFVRDAELLRFPVNLSGNLASGQTSGMQKAESLFPVLAVCLRVTNVDPVAPLSFGAQAFKLSEARGREFRLLSWHIVENSPDIKTGLPGQDIMLYFEAEGLMSGDIILEVSTVVLGEVEPFALRLPTKNIRIIQDITQPVQPESSDMTIIKPLEGQNVTPGEKIDIQLSFTEKIAKPDQILILSPYFTFEDHYANRLYELRIENDAPAGPYQLTVLAVWQQPEEPLTISQSLTLNVTLPVSKF